MILLPKWHNPSIPEGQGTPPEQATVEMRGSTPAAAAVPHLFASALPRPQLRMPTMMSTRRHRPRLMHIRTYYLRNFQKLYTTNPWLKGPNPNLQVETIEMSFQKRMVPPRSQLQDSTNHNWSLCLFLFRIQDAMFLWPSDATYSKLFFFHSARRVKIQWSSLLTWNRNWITKFLNKMYYYA